MFKNLIYIHISLIVLRMSFIAVFLKKQDPIKIHSLHLVVMKMTASHDYWRFNISSLTSVVIPTVLHNLSFQEEDLSPQAFLVKITHIINLRTFKINIKICVKI